MSHLEDFEKNRSKIDSVPVEAIKEPYIPVNYYAQEAEDLVTWAKEDENQLMAINYNPERFRLILELSGALHYVNAQCTKNRNAQSESMKTWKHESAEAVEVKDTLIHTFRFAFDQHDDLLHTLDEIEEGNSNSDLVQDMIDLSVLGKANTGLLKPYMDINLLNRSADISDRLGQVLAVANGDRHLPDASFELRNRVYTLLKEEVDHLRKCGKFLFWKNEKRLKGYSSQYLRRRHKAQKRAKQIAE